MQGMRVDAPIEMCRLLRPLEGTPRVRVHFDPRPDYARANVEIVAAGQGLEVVGGPTRLYLSSNVPAPYMQDGSPIRIDRPMFFSLSAGKPPAGRLGAGRRDRARADHSRLAGVGEDDARCRRLRPRRCCDRRSA